MPSHSYTADLMRYLRKRPNVWIDAREFEIFGRQAWRSRISDARLAFQAAKVGTIENRVQQEWIVIAGGFGRLIKRSQYRFVPSREPQAQALFDQTDSSETSERC